MLVKSECYQSRVVIFMTDIAIITATAKDSLLDIAKQSSALGIGLQNAAPGDKTGTPNNSVQYLLDISEELLQLAEECDKLLTQSSS